MRQGTSFAEIQIPTLQPDRASALGIWIMSFSGCLLIVSRWSVTLYLQAEGERWKRETSNKWRRWNAWKCTGRRTRGVLRPFGGRACSNVAGHGSLSWAQIPRMGSPGSVRLSRPRCIVLTLNTCATFAPQSPPEYSSESSRVLRWIEISEQRYNSAWRLRRFYLPACPEVAFGLAFNLVS